jgi:predicted thioesterase
MDLMIPLNTTARRTLVVEKEHLADEIGSGDVKVLATPMLIALMEAAALAAVQPYLSEGWTTVGVRLDVEHLRASALGSKITAEAVLIKREDRTLEYTVQAWDGRGVIGQGTHIRILVDREEFMSRIRHAD